jgi:hypothetical protein
LVFHEPASQTATLETAQTADDRQLAELLTGMSLIDQSTLAVLLQEARQRSSSLRDALVDGDYLTSYQMELIEAGKLEALVLGPLRVVDRLRMTPLETVYQVYDPRHGQEALLRCLSSRVSREQQAEFRRLFTKASQLRHINLVATLEVLDLEGSPAALQEWGVGLPSDEWAELAAPPDVWLWLVGQAAEGLAAAHEAGLGHGHLSAGRLVLTEQGTLRICGLGEPRWLFPEQELPKSGEIALSSAEQDLRALGLIAARWLTTGERGPVAKSLLAALQQTVARLVSPQPRKRFASAKALLDHLAELRQQVPEDAAAREKLLALVRSRLGIDVVEARRRASA